MPVTEGVAENVGVQLFWRVSHPETSDRGHRVLLINGLGSPLVAFEDHFVELFVARGYTVARFDNRDVGRSSRVREAPAGRSQALHPYSLADMADDAVAVMDAIGWSSAHVLGQSMGGAIAQQLALDHPSRVDSLIALMAASGERGFGRPTTEALAALMESAPADADGWLEHRVRTERIWASPDHWSEDWVRAKGQAMLAHGVDPEGASRQFRAVMAAGSRDEELAGLATPTLVIHGREDTLIQPDGGRHLADVIPGARYEEIDGLGHDLPPPLMPRLVDMAVAFVDGLG